MTIARSVPVDTGIGMPLAMVRGHGRRQQDWTTWRKRRLHTAAFPFARAFGVGNHQNPPSPPMSVAAVSTGAAFLILHDRMSDLRASYGLTMKDLNLDLGPLGTLLPPVRPDRLLPHPVLHPDRGYSGWGARFPTNLGE
ncbi:hypothetical protein Scel_10930 [Streptomyces cellostaticus]|nr:hypothetical protein Scel_10930 [Streptomyces cellostaticus]